MSLKSQFRRGENAPVPMICSRGLAQTCEDSLKGLSCLKYVPVCLPSYFRRGMAGAWACRNSYCKYRFSRGYGTVREEAFSLVGGGEGWEQISMSRKSYRYKTNFQVLNRNKTEAPTSRRVARAITLPVEPTRLKQSLPANMLTIECSRHTYVWRTENV